MFALLLNASCNKDDDGADSSSKGSGALLPNSWTVKQVPQKTSNESVSYRATTVQSVAGQLVASQVLGAETHTIRVAFNGTSLPSSQGYYKIVAANPGPDEVTISTSSICNGCVPGYIATGNDSAYAKVSILNKKVNVRIVPFWAKSSTTAKDSAQIFGSLDQP